MASLVKKIKKGKPYWYAVQSQRVNGRPRIVWQKYLGRVDTILRVLDSAQARTPQEVRIREFGATAALLDAAQKLDLAGLIDRSVPASLHQPSLGQYIVVMALNRAIAPSSKVKLGEWFKASILSRVWRASDDAFTSQRCWDAMDLLTQDAMCDIEGAIAERLIQDKEVDSDTLLYDTTNFTTFVSSTNKRNTIAQRGKSKKKRTDLRIVGVALLASKGYGIPILHETYPGNWNDATEFKEVALALLERYRQLRPKQGEVTIVFDKGNTSEDVLTIFDDHGLKYVSSAKYYHYPDLLKISAEHLQPLSGQRFAGVRAYRQRRLCNDGVERTMVLVWSDIQFAKQAANIMDNVADIMQKLAKESDYLKGLKRKSAKPDKRSKQALERRVGEILKSFDFRYTVSKVNKDNRIGQKAESIVSVTIGEDDDGYPTIGYEVARPALQQKIDERCGKQILFTNRDAWTTEDIVEAYRSQSEIEDIFRVMNDRQFMHWQPAYHWTDQKIRVHTFYCVLALLLVSLVRKRLTKSGINLSTHELLEQLADIKEVDVVYPPKENTTAPQLVTTYSALVPLQRQILVALGLDAWKAAEG